MADIVERLRADAANWFDLFEPRSRGDRVIGVHLSPNRFFIGSPPQSPLEFTEVIRTVGTSGGEVLVTRMGGLFFRPPQTFPDPYRTHPGNFEDEREKKENFQYSVSGYFNEVICELGLNGIISEPASPACLAYGQLVDNHALITVAGLPDSVDVHFERTIWPGLFLKYGGVASIHSLHAETDLDPGCQMRHSSTLLMISPLLPTLVASAYSSFWRGLDAEAVSTGWVVIEKLLDNSWEMLVSKIQDSKRKERLQDEHVYSASVRLELLLLNQAISEVLYRDAQDARKLRNDLVHKTKLPPDASERVLSVMRRMIEIECGCQLRAPTRTIRPVW